MLFLQPEQTVESHEKEELKKPQKEIEGIC